MTTTKPKRSIEEWKQDYSDPVDLILGTKLSDFAFTDVGLPDDFYLPEGLTEIGSNSLEGTELHCETFGLPDSLKTIGKSAFEEATYWYNNKKYYVPSSTDVSFMRAWFENPEQSK